MKNVVSIGNCWFKKFGCDWENFIISICFCCCYLVFNCVCVWRMKILSYCFMCGTRVTPSLSKWTSYHPPRLNFHMTTTSWSIANPKRYWTMQKIWERFLEVIVLRIQYIQWASVASSFDIWIRWWWNSVIIVFLFSCVNSKFFFFSFSFSSFIWGRNSHVLLFVMKHWMLNLQRVLKKKLMMNIEWTCKW